MLSNPSSDTFNEDEILYHSLALTDLIFGLYAIELWRYNDVNGKLVNVPLCRDEEVGSGGCGMLIKRITQEADPRNAYSTPEAIDAYRKLTDPSYVGFLPPLDFDVGVGLPGVLWAESAPVKTEQHSNVSSISKGNVHRSVKGGQGSVVWRNVEELANDPDQPQNERLQSFSKAGFKLARGIQFNSNGCRGIVIFFGNPHAPKEKLNNPTNSNFMYTAAHLIGGAAAAKAQLQDMKLFRKKLRDDAWHKTKVKITMIVSSGDPLPTEEEESLSSKLYDESEKSKNLMQKIHQALYHFRRDAKGVILDATNSAKTKTSRYLKKIQGGSAGIPPSFSNSQTMVTFVGVFITHLILSRLNLPIQTQSNKELSLILAPLGALSTLQFCLTAAPASQPRNALFAQVFSITASILLSYIPNIDPWLRAAIAPAIVIPCMARFGIIHPPAGATSVVFSSGKYGWEHMGIFLSGVCISISTAVIINNWSEKRQYPTSWYLIRKAKTSCSRKECDD